MKKQQYGGPIDEKGCPQGTCLWHMMVKLVSYTNIEGGRFWQMMRYLMYGPLSGSHSFEKSKFTCVRRDSFLSFSCLFQNIFVSLHPINLFINS